MKKINSWILKSCGWKIENSIKLPNKCVLCIAPHTSNWDFIWGMLLNSVEELKAKFFMKKEWFRFPLGYFMRSIGGVAVDRSKKNTLTDQMAAEFSKHEKFRIGVTPEGTRQYNPEWKKGFYYIACKANVPIVLGYIDYKKKEMGFGEIIIPTGDYETDILKIKEFYKEKKGKIPCNFGF